MDKNNTQWKPYGKGQIRESVRIYNDEKFSLGDSSWISDDCYIDAQGGIEIGRDTIIGSHTHIYSSEHGILPEHLIREQSHVKKKTVIGSDVWIGANVVVTAGVIIGDHAVIGAGAVVTHNVPEWEIWAGNPARKIGDRRLGKI